MRAFMIIAFASMFFLSAWANSLDIAGAGPTGAAHPTNVTASDGY